MSTARYNKNETTSITLNESVKKFLDTPLINVVGILLLMLVCIGVSVNVQVDKDKVGLDMQVKVKLLFLACFGLYGIWGFMTSSKVQRVLFSFPALWMVAIFGFYVASVPFAYAGKTEAFASTLTILIVLLGTLGALNHLGVWTVLNTIFYSTAIFIGGQLGNLLCDPVNRRFR